MALEETAERGTCVPVGGQGHICPPALLLSHDLRAEGSIPPGLHSVFPHSSVGVLKGKFHLITCRNPSSDGSSTCRSLGSSCLHYVGVQWPCRHGAAPGGKSNATASPSPGPDLSGVTRCCMGAGSRFPLLHGAEWKWEP